MPLEIRYADQVAPSIRNVGTNFTDMRRSFGRYISLADSSHGIDFYVYPRVLLDFRGCVSHFGH
jgi:hypothetical protein